MWLRLDKHKLLLLLAIAIGLRIAVLVGLFGSTSPTANPAA